MDSLLTDLPDDDQGLHRYVKVLVEEMFSDGIINFGRLRVLLMVSDYINKQKHVNVSLLIMHYLFEQVRRLHDE